MSDDSRLFGMMVFRAMDQLTQLLYDRTDPAGAPDVMLAVGRAIIVISKLAEKMGLDVRDCIEMALAEAGNEEGEQ